MTIDEGGGCGERIAEGHFSSLAEYDCAGNDGVGEWEDSGGGEEGFEVGAVLRGKLVVSEDFNHANGGESRRVSGDEAT